MESTAPKAPDLNCCIIINNKWVKIGVAWQNQDGKINIKLNPLVQVPVSPETTLMLFPNAYKDSPKPQPKKPRTVVDYEIDEPPPY